MICDDSLIDTLGLYFFFYIVNKIHFHVCLLKIIIGFITGYYRLNDEEDSMWLYVS